ncbi:MAG: low molecular weight phosphotyrosine protein phosphatase [Deltaproteobacteria bacterium]|jgi:protein-tyrosine phosphatase|nr:low molecular weight phosphotyrosine protein phosphatase [Deltaproteobacteria bacterium]MBW2496705.1 low molecular weight phosphotyrosine protein phosphatase [Deltaproteobacteria bacterium]
MSDTRLGVCFVCLGNICRSPTAEGVMRKLVAEVGLEPRIEVESAGTAAYHAGELPDRRSRDAARRRGLRLESRARQFLEPDFARFDFVLAMDQENLAHLEALRPSPHIGGHLGLLRDFDPLAAPLAEVPDPYYGGARGFDEVLDICEAACLGLLEHIRTSRGWS